MSDAWDEIQAIKSKRNSLREKLEKRKKERQDIFGATTLLGVSPIIGNNATVKIDLIDDSTIISLKLDLDSDADVEKTLLQLLSSSGILLPINSAQLVTKIEKVLERAISRDTVHYILKKLASQSIVGIKKVTIKGETGYELILINQNAISNLYNEFMTDNTFSKKIENDFKRKHDSEEEDDENSRKSFKSEKRIINSKESSNDASDIMSLLSMPSTREKQSKQVGEEILELLTKPTAKERSLAEKFKSHGGAQVMEFCPHGTRVECLRAQQTTAEMSSVTAAATVTAAAAATSANNNINHNHTHNNHKRLLNTSSSSSPTTPTKTATTTTTTITTDVELDGDNTNADDDDTAAAGAVAATATAATINGNSSENNDDNNVTNNRGKSNSNLDENLLGNTEKVESDDDNDNDNNVLCAPISSSSSVINGDGIDAYNGSNGEDNECIKKENVNVENDNDDGVDGGCDDDDGRVEEDGNDEDIDDNNSKEKEGNSRTATCNSTIKTISINITAGALIINNSSSCRNNNNENGEIMDKCKKLHFKKIIQSHTDESLGDCSFLNTCFHMTTCKYVHYEVDMSSNSSNNSRHEDVKGYSNTLVKRTTDPSATLYPPQWIQCDLRYLDMTVLGKFAVVMADPPWDIHMELPYGTMSDDEMRQLGVPALQDDGLIFLWVTGRAMELGRECLKLWGYERVDELIWVKTNQLQRIIRTGRTGHWLNHGKEHCLVGMKGNPKNLNRGLDCDVIVAEVRATSHKPDEIYGIIERLSPGTRKIELFGRPHNVQPNWITLGNQLDGIRLVDPELIAQFQKRYPDGNCMAPASTTKK